VLRTEQTVLSLYAALYDEVVPKDHLLRKIDAMVDFGFVCGLVRESYSEYYGRPAVHPEIVMRLLFLQFLYDLSDEQVIEQAQVNMAFKWFLGLNPEAKPPDASVLSRFRTLRLARSEQTIDSILDSIVKQCVEKGLIESQRVVVDATHVLADTKLKTPVKVLRSAVKKIMKAMKRHYPRVASELPKMPDTHDLSLDETIKAMLNHLQTLVEQCEETVDKKGPVGDALKRGANILADEHRGMTSGAGSVEDLDARFGHKSMTDTFFGYKQHIAMLDKDEIITACEVTAGNAQDGEQLPALLGRSSRNQTKVTQMLGDAAYCSMLNLQKMKRDSIEAFVPISAVLQAKVDPRFQYNKDSDQWICAAGHATCRKNAFTLRRTKNTILRGYYYHWETKTCVECPLRTECRRNANSRSGRKLMITEHNDDQKAALARQKDPANDAIRKRRRTIEHKCAELKRFCGMARARYRSLILVRLQAVIASVVANAKRMVRLAEKAEVAAA
jgi:transposase